MQNLINALQNGNNPIQHPFVPNPRANAAGDNGGIEVRVMNRIRGLLQGQAITAANANGFVQQILNNNDGNANRLDQYNGANGQLLWGNGVQIVPDPIVDALKTFFQAAPQPAEQALVLQALQEGLVNQVQNAVAGNDQVQNVLDAINLRIRAKHAMVEYLQGINQAGNIQPWGVYNGGIQIDPNYQEEVDFLAVANYMQNGMGLGQEAGMHAALQVAAGGAGQVVNAENLHAVVVAIDGEMQNQLNIAVAPQVPAVNLNLPVANLIVGLQNAQLNALPNFINNLPVGNNAQIDGQIILFLQAYNGNQPIQNAVMQNFIHQYNALPLQQQQIISDSFGRIAPRNIANNAATLFLDSIFVPHLNAVQALGNVINPDAAGFNLANAIQQINNLPAYNPPAGYANGQQFQNIKNLLNDRDNAGQLIPGGVSTQIKEQLLRELCFTLNNPAQVWANLQVQGALAGQAVAAANGIQPANLANVVGHMQGAQAALQRPINIENQRRIALAGELNRIRQIIPNIVGINGLNDNNLSVLINNIEGHVGRALLYYLPQDYQEAKNSVGKIREVLHRAKGATSVQQKAFLRNLYNALPKDANGVLVAIDANNLQQVVRAIEGIQVGQLVIDAQTLAVNKPRKDFRETILRELRKGVFNETGYGLAQANLAGGGANANRQNELNAAIDEIVNNANPGNNDLLEKFNNYNNILVPGAGQNAANRLNGVNGQNEVDELNEIQRVLNGQDLFNPATDINALIVRIQNLQVHGGQAYANAIGNPANENGVIQKIHADLANNNLLPNGQPVIPLERKREILAHLQKHLTQPVVANAVVAPGAQPDQRSVGVVLNKLQYRINPLSNDIDLEANGRPQDGYGKGILHLVNALSAAPVGGVNAGDIPLIGVAGQPGADEDKQKLIEKLQALVPGNFEMGDVINNDTRLRIDEQMPRFIKTLDNERKLINAVERIRGAFQPGNIVVNTGVGGVPNPANANEIGNVINVINNGGVYANGDYQHGAVVAEICRFLAGQDAAGNPLNPLPTDQEKIDKLNQLRDIQVGGVAVFQQPAIITRAHINGVDNVGEIRYNNSIISQINNLMHPPLQQAGLGARIGAGVGIGAAAIIGVPLAVALAPISVKILYDVSQNHNLQEEPLNAAARAEFNRINGLVPNVAAIDGLSDAGMQVLVANIVAGAYNPANADILVHIRTYLQNQTDLKERKEFLKAIRPIFNAPIQNPQVNPAMRLGAARGLYNPQNYLPGTRRRLETALMDFLKDPRRTQQAAVDVGAAFANFDAAIPDNAGVRQQELQNVEQQNWNKYLITQQRLQHVQLGAGAGQIAGAGGLLATAGAKGKYTTREKFRTFGRFLDVAHVIPYAPNPDEQELRNRRQAELQAGQKKKYNINLDNGGQNLFTIQSNGQNTNLTVAEVGYKPSAGRLGRGVGVFQENTKMTVANQEAIQQMLKGESNPVKRAIAGALRDALETTGLQNRSSKQKEWIIRRIIEFTRNNIGNNFSEANWNRDQGRAALGKADIQGINFDTVTTFAAAYQDEMKKRGFYTKNDATQIRTDKAINQIGPELKDIPPHYTNRRSRLLQYTNGSSVCAIAAGNTVERNNKVMGRM